jgi:iron complex transport system ATP-binding protein
MSLPEPAVADARGAGLSLEHITAGYGADPVVRDVSLRVAAGEIVGLLGPNGSGKTTLVRVVSRALKPATGEVRLAGRDPYGMSGREAARLVAVVPQEVAPAFSFSVLEMVLFGRAPYLSRWGSGKPEDWTAAREAMSAVGVLHLADRPVEELSGGERRRVILAQALAQDAPILVMDEPTTHLDIRHTLDVVSIVRRLADDRATAVLAIFHDLNLASATCDRICALREGRLVAEGTPDEVITPELLRDVYDVEAEVEAEPLTGRPAVVLRPPDPKRSLAGRTVHVVGGAGRGARLMRRLVERGFDVTAGVLHVSDSDSVVAERLDLLRVSVPPFSEIDDQASGACDALMRAADVVVLCDAPYGPANLPNLRLVRDAAASGVPVLVVEEHAIAERDFTDGVATALWNEIRAGATVARSYEEALLALG